MLRIFSASEIAGVAARRLGLQIAREGQPLKRFNSFVRGCGMAMLLAALHTSGSAAQQPPIDLMPLPASVQQATGALPIDGKFSAALTGYSEPRLERAVQRFRKQLAAETGLVFLPQQAAKAGTHAYARHSPPRTPANHPGTGRRRILHSGSNAHRRETKRRNAARHHARPANISAASRRDATRPSPRPPSPSRTNQDSRGAAP